MVKLIEHMHPLVQLLLLVCSPWVSLQFSVVWQISDRVLLSMWRNTLRCIHAYAGRAMAEKISEEQLKPLAQRVANEAEPRTKEATQQYLRDPAKQVAQQVMTRLSCLGASAVSLGWQMHAVAEAPMLCCSPNTRCN